MVPIDINKIDEALDDYERRIGLPQIEFDKLEKIDEYLSMSREGLERLSPQDCAEIAYILKQHAFYIQKSQNREQSRITFAKNTVDQIIASEIPNYNGSWSAVRDQAIKHNDVAVKLNKIMIYATMRSDRLAFLSKAIVGLADTLVHIQFTKRGNNG